jgi:hypothetical protein
VFSSGENWGDQEMTFIEVTWGFWICEVNGDRSKKLLVLMGFIDGLC